MAANRHKKIRAALCYTTKNTKLSRLHNNSNVITLGSRLTKKNSALKLIDVFYKTKFEDNLKKIEGEPYASRYDADTDEMVLIDIDRTAAEGVIHEIPGGRIPMFSPNYRALIQQIIAANNQMINL